MGNRDCVFPAADPPLPNQAFELAGQIRVCSPVDNINTRAPGSSNGPLAAETEPDPGELVPELAEEDRPRAVTPAGLAGYCRRLLLLGLLPRGKRRQREKHVQSCKSSGVSRWQLRRLKKQLDRMQKSRGRARRKRKPLLLD